MDALSVMGLIEKLGTSALLFILFLILLRWVMKNQDKILEQANKQNQDWQKITDEKTEALKGFRTEVKDAHKYQRDEHKQICDTCQNIALTLERINNK